MSGNLIVIGKNNLLEPNSRGELGSRTLIGIESLFELTVFAFISVRP